MVTIKERIVKELKRDNWLDDDELTVRLGLKRRQVTNQAARQLAADGTIVRRKQSGYKIVNGLPTR